MSIGASLGRAFAEEVPSAGAAEARTSLVLGLVPHGYRDNSRLSYEFMNSTVGCYRWLPKKGAPWLRILESPKPPSGCWRLPMRSNSHDGALSPNNPGHPVPPSVTCDPDSATVEA